MLSVLSFMIASNLAWRSVIVIAPSCSIMFSESDSESIIPFFPDSEIFPAFVAKLPLSCFRSRVCVNIFFIMALVCPLAIIIGEDELVGLIPNERTPAHGRWYEEETENPSATIDKQTRPATNKLLETTIFPKTQLLKRNSPLKIIFFENEKRRDSGSLLALFQRGRKPQSLAVVEGEGNPHSPSSFLSLPATKAIVALPGPLFSQSRYYM
jgi:hypothetical protein